MNIEDRIIADYAGRNDDLAGRIIALAAGQNDLGAADLTVDALAPYDEMHVGGRPATRRLLSALGLHADMRVLDVGCGIGGAARSAAADYGCRVTGLDLVPEYVATAALLTELVGLGDLCDFELGSAAAMRFSDTSFDAAYTIHAGMNIADKGALYRDVFRVLRAGGGFAVYDLMVMAGADCGAIAYPMPWAADAQTSFLITPDDAQELLRDAGFTVRSVEIRTEAGEKAMAAATQRAAENPDDPVQGAGFGVRVAHLRAAMAAGIITPVQIVAYKQAP